MNYTAPSQEVFDEIKEGAIAVWKRYDDTFGYASEKINRVQSINNIEDNWGFIVSMFDIHNKQKLFEILQSDEAKGLVAQAIEPELEAQKRWKLWGYSYETRNKQGAGRGRY